MNFEFLYKFYYFSRRVLCPTQQNLFTFPLWYPLLPLKLYQDSIEGEGGRDRYARGWDILILISIQCTQPTFDTCVMRHVISLYSVVLCRGNRLCVSPYLFYSHLAIVIQGKYWNRSSVLLLALSALF